MGAQYHQRPDLLGLLEITVVPANPLLHAYQDEDAGSREDDLGDG